MLTPSQHDLIRHCSKDEIAFQALVNLFEGLEAERAQVQAQADLITKIFDHLPVVVGFRKPDSPTLTLNRQWERVFGWSIEELTSPNTLMQKLYPDPALRQQAFEAAIQRDRNWHDFKNITCDGRELDMSWMNLALEDGTVMAVGMDITERKQIEIALRRNERMLNDTGRLAKMGGWEYDAVHDRVLWTAQLYTIHEVSQDYDPNVELALSFFTPESRAILEPLFHQAIYAGIAYDVELEIITAKNRPLWVRVICEPQIEDGRVVRLSGTLQDITELKLALEAEREQRALAQAMLDSVTALNSTLKFDEVLQRILTNIVRVIPHDWADISLIEQGYTKVVAIRDADGERITRTWTLQFPVAETRTFATMSQTRHPIIVNFTQKNSEWRTIYREKPTHSYLGAPIVLQDEVIGFINLNSDDPGFFEPEHAERLAVFALHAALAIQNARAFERESELASLTERQRLARDLHDAVSQTLFSSSIIAETLPMLFDNDPNEVRDGLAKLVRLTRGAIAEMRSMLLEMRPAALEHTGLVTLLTNLVNGFRVRSGAEITLLTEGDGSCIHQEAKIALYRIAQEALNNVIKHANASVVEIKLQCENTSGYLQISDNGKGFDLQSVKPDGLGLKIMHERAEDVGLTLEIESQHNRGTHIKLSWDKRVYE